MVHLVYCDKKAKVLQKILSGEKTMVVRGAAGRKIPHSRVFAGETLYFMEQGSKKISASATVSEVFNFVKLSEEAIAETLAAQAQALNLTEEQKKRWHRKCLCLIRFEAVRKITPPLDFDRQKNMDDWLILEKIEDAVVGASVPYNYEKSRF